MDLLSIAGMCLWQIINLKWAEWDISLDFVEIETLLQVAISILADILT